MIKVLPYIIFIIFASAASGCVDDSTIIEDIEVKKDVGAQFYGEWKSVKKSFIYGSILTINKDSTFGFSYGACEMSGNSVGNWTVIGDELILNSTEEKECLYIIEFGIYGLEVIGEETIFPPRKTTNEGCDPQFSSEEYVLFSDESFVLSNDTLIHTNPKDSIDIESNDKFFKEQQ